MTEKTILVLYYTRGVYPLRNTIETHLYSWRRYSRHKIVYINVALGFPEALVRRLDVDVVLFHTIFLGMRWSPQIFRTYTQKCSILKSLRCIKIALPQDEFINTELLNDFINDFGVTHILTCASEPDWPVIYDKVDRSRVVLKTVLTGYLDHETVERIEIRKKRVTERDIDIGYRAWKAEYWLGEHGQHKARIAELFEGAARRKNLRTDISTRNEDVLAGYDWFDFLLRCRATIGVEGGASVLDRNGEIKDRVDAYLRNCPGATFEETRRNCFPGDDNKLGLSCISPRHLEACATGTLQFLIEGGYNGILRPWRHYVPIKKDYSNLDDALDILNDRERMREMTEAAFADIVKSGKWTYKAFVHDIESTIIDTPARDRARWQPSQAFVRGTFALKDHMNWRFIQFEVWCLAGLHRKRFARLVYRFFSRLFPAV